MYRYGETTVRDSGLHETGFHDRRAPVGSARLTHAVAVSLAIGSLSVCLAVALTIVSVKLAIALPL